MTTVNFLFTRHDMTLEQASAMLSADVVVDQRAEASVLLQTTDDARRVVQEWINVAVQHAADVINVYGVIPPIVRHVLVYQLFVGGIDRTLWIHTYEAHNLVRSPEHTGAAFLFGEWLHTGSYLLG